ncbi:hypothetical protein FB382_001110 [Nocardioides ginsengisegetis]|uniref:Uncharacterized protein n=1 Tax=Nocardioides ginsengisegetis TaxID=661491 RepID=A0A7W3IYE2_9ACTN|nr:hypothetical protein [Nocardioides ginsengisegetis]MBA8802819.1 hypothetical protein [Nocardioides ginsengisegetis]
MPGGAGQGVRPADGHPEDREPPDAQQVGHLGHVVGHRRVRRGGGRRASVAGPVHRHQPYAGSPGGVVTGAGRVPGVGAAVQEDDGRARGVAALLELDVPAVREPQQRHRWPATACGR